MNEFRQYALTILVHPQTATTEREAVESLVRGWVEERKGIVSTVTADQKHRLAYDIHHVRQATFLTMRFELPATSLNDLEERLRRQKKILRFALHAQSPRPADQKTLKDVAFVPTAAAEKPSSVPKKEKATMEKLDEKIEKILEEEVL